MIITRQIVWFVGFASEVKPSEVFFHGVGEKVVGHDTYFLRGKSSI